MLENFTVPKKQYRGWENEEKTYHHGAIGTVPLGRGGGGYFVLFRVPFRVPLGEGGGGYPTPTEQRVPHFLVKTEHTDPPWRSSQGRSTKSSYFVVAACD